MANQKEQACAELEGSTYDWTTFEKRIKIKASVSDIYNSWTTSEGLTSWFLKSAKYVTEEQVERKANESFQRGDSYQWTWFGYDGLEENKVFSANGVDSFSFGFAQVCRVDVSIVNSTEGAEVILIQSEIPVNEEGKVNWHLGCSIGWMKYLMNLKAVLETGVDLR